MAPDRRPHGAPLAIGALIGRIFRYAFGALAVAMNVVGYWFSDRLALKASRARPVEAGTNPVLEATVQDLCSARAGSRTAALHHPLGAAERLSDRAIRSTQRWQVTDGLVQQLPPEQVESVLAHELGHIKNRDILVSSIAAMV